MLKIKYSSNYSGFLFMALLHALLNTKKRKTENNWISNKSYPRIFLVSGNALGIWICGCRCILESSGSQNSVVQHSTGSLKISGCKRWCPKDLRVRAPAAPVLTHSLSGIAMACPAPTGLCSKQPNLHNRIFKSFYLLVKCTHRT